MKLRCIMCGCFAIPRDTKDEVQQELPSAVTMLPANGSKDDLLPVTDDVLQSSDCIAKNSADSIECRATSRSRVDAGVDYRYGMPNARAPLSSRALVGGVEYDSFFVNPLAEGSHEGGLPISYAGAALRGPCLTLGLGLTNPLATEYADSCSSTASSAPHSPAQTKIRAAGAPPSVQSPARDKGASVACTCPAAPGTPLQAAKVKVIGIACSSSASEDRSGSLQHLPISGPPLLTTQRSPDPSAGGAASGSDGGGGAAVAAAEGSAAALYTKSRPADLTPGLAQLHYMQVREPGRRLRSTAGRGSAAGCARSANLYVPEADEPSQTLSEQCGVNGVGCGAPSCGGADRSRRMTVCSDGAAVSCGGGAAAADTNGAGGADAAPAGRGSAPGSGDARESRARVASSSGLGQVTPWTPATPSDAALMPRCAIGSDTLSEQHASDIEEADDEAAAAARGADDAADRALAAAPAAAAAAFAPCTPPLAARDGAAAAPPGGGAGVVGEARVRSQPGDRDVERCARSDGGDAGQQPGLRSVVSAPPPEAPPLVSPTEPSQPEALPQVRSAPVQLAAAAAEAQEAEGLEAEAGSREPRPCAAGLEEPQAAESGSTRPVTPAGLALPLSSVAAEGPCRGVERGRMEQEEVEAATEAAQLAERERVVEVEEPSEPSAGGANVGSAAEPAAAAAASDAPQAAWVDAAPGPQPGAVVSTMSPPHRSVELPLDTRSTVTMPICYPSVPLLQEKSKQQQQQGTEANVVSSTPDIAPCEPEPGTKEAAEQELTAVEVKEEEVTERLTQLQPCCITAPNAPVTPVRPPCLAANPITNPTTTTTTTTGQASTPPRSFPYTSTHAPGSKTGSSSGGSGSGGDGSSSSSGGSAAVCPVTPEQAEPPPRRTAARDPGCSISGLAMTRHLIRQLGLIPDAKLIAAEAADQDDSIAPSSSPHACVPAERAGVPPASPFAGAVGAAEAALQSAAAAADAVVGLPTAASASPGCVSGQGPGVNCAQQDCSETEQARVGVSAPSVGLLEPWKMAQLNGVENGGGGRCEDDDPSSSLSTTRESSSIFDDRGSYGRYGTGLLSARSMQGWLEPQGWKPLRERYGCDGEEQPRGVGDGVGGDDDDGDGDEEAGAIYAASMAATPRTPRVRFGPASP